MTFTTHLNITPSATVTINSLALQKKQKGERVYNLAAGEPMIDTPAVIKQAAMEAIEKNFTHYPPVAGLPELRTAAAEWFNSNYRADYQPDNILVSVGGKMGLFLLLQALLAPGDEVLIGSPYWVSYPSLVKLFGGVPKIIETDAQNGWKLDVEKLRAGCSGKSKVLILNSGSNPTGTIYAAEELKKLLKFAAEKNLFVISDEVYSCLVYDEKKFTSCAGFPEFKNNLAVIQSCSKNLAMTGWRVGFVFAPADVIRILTDLTGQSTSGVTTIAQYAALAGLQNAGSISSGIREEMQKRRDMFIGEFNRLFQTGIEKPVCGLYSFVPLRALGVAEIDSVEFCGRTLDEANVAITPGAAFGKEGYVRFSFGEREEELKEGLAHLAGYAARFRLPTA